MDFERSSANSNLDRTIIWRLEAECTQSAPLVSVPAAHQLALCAPSAFPHISELLKYLLWSTVRLSVQFVMTASCRISSSVVLRIIGVCVLAVVAFTVSTMPDKTRGITQRVRMIHTSEGAAAATAKALGVVAATQKPATEEIAVTKQAAAEEAAAENAPATKETGASLAGCEEWCIPYNDSWLVKCGWMKCAQCPQCVMRSKLKSQQLVVVAPGQVPATAEPVVVANGATQLAATEISIMGTARVAPRLPKLKCHGLTAKPAWITLAD